MSKKKTSLGFLFWIAFLLLIVVIFLFNRTRIESVVNSTGFFDVLKKKVGMETQPEVKISPLDTRPEGNTLSENSSGKNETVTGRTGESDQDVPTLNDPAVSDAEPESSAPAVEKQREKSVEPEKVRIKTTAPSNPATVPGKTDTKRSSGAEKQKTPIEKPDLMNTRKAKLYYVLVGDDGHINLKGVERTVSYKDSPMIATLDSLISGPTRHDISEGLMSLIPENSKLLSASVKNGTAFLNFNEAFKFNSLGMDGYLAQMKQVIYSATEFPTVKNVQILIEGNKQQYLTAEGIFIGAPLDRSSF